MSSRRQDLDDWRAELIDLAFAVMTRGEILDHVLSAESHYVYVASLKDDPDLASQ